ncbi:RHS repeat-associated core domain-containing protein [Paenibacillus barcinonensis]|uniref:RHS repeat-associated core domain-containing protein n=1 Tax=Paenibacillus barcinonensis TaxID=198119 RepID=A0A2V4VIG3_PAEBA|nr:RHS repeat-associated protein [Paenibacillus barcinonensis]QKS57005.1 RHS repeat-associated core domain-containing protein [Paenibacillus barcinonensis]
MLQETNAAGARIAYDYDERGWLRARLDAKGQETRYEYDAAGRLIRATDEAGEIVLTYTTDGQVARVLEAEQHEERTYDAAGRLLTRTDGFGHLLQYTYDAAGRMTALTYPDGKEVEYRYHATGELAEVKDWNGRLTRYRYDASGKLIDTRRPNGSQEQREYDAAGQLIRLTDTSGQGIRLQQFKYEYSPGGLLLKEENKQYTYDTLKRLRSGAEPGRIVHYTYDPSGNLTSEQVGISPNEPVGNLPTQQQLYYTWDNRLQRVGNYPVEMDANGNLLYATDGSTASAYEYDARNRLVKAGKLKYRYNPQGDRIQLAQRGQVIRYVIDDAPELSRVLMELDGEGNVKARYVYGLGLIGREDADGTYLSYHYDLRGSTTLLTNEQNRVTDRYTYGLYGELEQHEDVTSQPFAYNGRDGVMTDANGLYYMRARYYDPKLKRFLNRDVIRGEIQDGQTFNRYAYVNGNPVSYIDPLGLMKCETTKRISENSNPNTGRLKLDLQLFASEGKSPSSWKPGMDVTEEHVREAMKNAPVQTQQTAVSLPAIDRYTKRLAEGEVPPPIKVDNNIIVDGNHRYISGRVAGIDIPTTPYSGGKTDKVIRWEDVKIDPYDWGNR